MKPTFQEEATRVVWQSLWPSLFIQLTWGKSLSFGRDTSCIVFIFLIDLFLLALVSIVVIWSVYTHASVLRHCQWSDSGIWVKSEISLDVYIYVPGKSKVTKNPNKAQQSASQLYLLRCVCVFLLLLLILSGSYGQKDTGNVVRLIWRPGPLLLTWMNYLKINHSKCK